MFSLLVVPLLLSTDSVSQATDVMAIYCWVIFNGAIATADDASIQALFRYGSRLSYLRCLQQGQAASPQFLR